MREDAKERRTVILSTERRRLDAFCGRPSERGAAAVEFAIILLPLLMLLLGIVEFGRVYSLQLRLQHAARDAARELALHHDDPDYGAGGSLNIVDLANDTLEAALGQDLVAGLSGSVIVPCNAATDRASVELSYQVQLAIPMPDNAGIAPFTVSAQALMPCDG